MAGWEGIKMASTKPAWGLILVNTGKLRTIIKAQISGKLVTSGNSDIAFDSVFSEKTHLKS